LMQKGQLQNAPVDPNAVLDEPHHHRSKIGQTPPDFVLQNQTPAVPDTLRERVRRY